LLRDLVNIGTSDDEQWVVARPTTPSEWRMRVKAAWGVLIGKYDALKYIGQ